MHQSKPVSTSLSASIKLSALEGSFFEDPQFYRSIVDSIQYFAFTRLDLSFAVNKVFQFMHCPRLPHWQAVKCILRYLRFTTHFGLYFSSSSSFKLTAFSNAAWVGCPDDWKSTGSFCVYFGSHLISWD